MIRLIWIAIGGALGTLLRYGVGGFVYRHMGGVFPWGTLAVNLCGAFIIGFLSALFEATAISPTVRSFATIGVLGGFTTFSTYTLESFNLVRDGELRLALSNILFSNVLGILLVFAGIVAFRYLAAALRLCLR
jgi:CrcB protein